MGMTSKDRVSFSRHFRKKIRMCFRTSRGLIRHWQNRVLEFRNVPESIRRRTNSIVGS